MKFLKEFFPIILFFVAYKFYGQLPASFITQLNSWSIYEFNAGAATDSIYFATLIAIIASGMIVMIHYLKERNFDKNQTLTFVLFLIFGGATLFLRDPAFVKWKPTIINLLFAAVFLGSFFIGKKTMVERLMSAAMQAPQQVWLRLNMAWVTFFVTVVGLNLYIAYQFSEQTWVNFKLFGMMGLTLLFLIMQMVVLSRYITIKPEE